MAYTKEGNMLRVLLIIFSCVFLVFPSSVLGTESNELVFKFEFPSPDADVNMPAPQAVGNLILLDGVTIPAFALAVGETLEEGYVYHQPETMTLEARIKPEFAGRFNAYYLNYYGRDGWLLVPKTWRPTWAQIGANGSGSFIFAPPAGEKGFLSFQSDGVCLGCAMINASLYFPEVRAEALEDFGQAYTSSKPPLDSIVDIRPHTKAWRVILDGQNIDGITYYNPDEDSPLFIYSVSIPGPDHDLATPILNWLLPPRE